jgi:hypothetical protein
MTNAAKIEKNEAVVFEAPNTPHELKPVGFREWRAPAMPVKAVEETPGPVVEDKPETRSILREADAIAGESRSRDYGHPFKNHQRIAAMWNIRLEDKLRTPLTPGDVAELMILLKCARLTNGYKRDSLLDIAGYVKCRDMIAEHVEKASNGV